MEVLETQYIQREYDGCWEKIVKVIDYENTYEYRDEAGVHMKLIPEKWITVAVYPISVDFLGSE